MAGELLHVALALNAGRSAEELIDVLFDSRGALVQFNRIGLAVVEPNDYLRLTYIRSRRPIHWGVGARASVSSSSLWPVIHERKIRIMDDLHAYGRAHPGSLPTQAILREGMRASPSLPLPGPSGVKGVLFLSSCRPYTYKRRHIELLSTIAAAIGTALQRGRLLDDLRAAAERLETLDRLETNFPSNLSHELRTPLTILLSEAYALEDGIAGEPSPSQIEHLGILIRNGNRLAALLFDLAPLLDEVAGMERPALEAAGLAFEVVLPASGLLVDGDPGRLAQVASILLDNARKFTPAGGRVALHARPQRGPGLAGCARYRHRHPAEGAAPRLREVFPGQRRCLAGLRRGWASRSHGRSCWRTSASSSYRTSQAGARSSPSRCPARTTTSRLNRFLSKSYPGDKTNFAPTPG